MAYENLLNSVEESAQEKERDLREKARQTIEEIVRDTKNQALVIQQSRLAEAKKAAAVERNKLIYLTKGENKEKLIRTRETIFAKAFLEAEHRLSVVRKDPSYPDILKKLTLEAVKALGEEQFRVHIDRRDEHLMKKILTELHLSPDISADLQSAGGVIVSTPDGSVRISNTFESRLERAKERNKLEIYTMLGG